MQNTIIFKINRFLFCFLVAQMMSLSVYAQCTGVAVGDSLSLVELYNSTNGEDWNNNSGWLIDPVEEWYGITLTTNGCNLKRINLSSNNLAGGISEISNFSELIQVNIGNNPLNGNIPNFFNVPKLETLHFISTLFSGNIPDFNNLPNLEELWFSSDELTGSMPDFSNLPTLRELQISGNQITGSIPDFNHLPTLRELHINGNQITDNIPDFNNLPELRELHIVSTQIMGNIPDFNNIPKLITLRLQYNKLTGNIPNFSNLPELSSMVVVQNQLSGNIPDFNNIPNLVLLQLHSNELTGNIPNFNNLPDLNNLTLFNNQLSGSIPDFSNVPNLLQLIFGGNQLTGTVPNFSNLPVLSNLGICPNPLVGGIPSFSNCPNVDITEIDLSCIQGPQSTGYVFYDENNNCLKDSTEIGIPNTLIKTDDDAYYAFTDSTGFYSLQTDTGTYTIEYYPPNYLWQQTCPASPDGYTINVITHEDSLGGFDFANEAVLECPLMTVELGTPLLRRCFTNTYTIDYCNQGTAEATDVSIMLWLPYEMTPLSSSLPYTIDTDYFLHFDIGTVGIGECGSFTLTDSISCDAVLGSAVCVEAYIFPDTICALPSAMWDGSDIRVSGYCLDDDVQFVIENTGGNMADSTQYRIYEDDILSAIDMFKLTSGETLAINLPATGVTYRLEADQRPGYPYSPVSQATVELCGLDPSLGFVLSQPDYDGAPFYEMDCQEIIGSFDPNDKTVLPKGIGEGHHISETAELEYRIRFQNTGNDTAFQVIVMDTIDTNHLDLSSLHLGVSSHPYSFEVKNGNVLVFLFENILLPDSTTNEQESHGFFKFKIAQHPDNPIGNLIENEVAIYFDYNQPVITNKVFNTIGLPDFVTGIEALPFSPDKLQAKVWYADQMVQIHIPFVAANTRYSFSLYNAMGQRVTQTKSLLIPNHQVPLQALATGVYVYEIRGTDGAVSSGKLVITP